MATLYTILFVAVMVFIVFILPVMALSWLLAVIGYSPYSTSRVMVRRKTGGTGVYMKPCTFKKRPHAQPTVQDQMWLASRTRDLFNKVNGGNK